MLSLKKVAWILVAVSSIAASGARADDSNFYVPLCGTSARSDSFGRGIKDQALGTQSGLNFELADANCYALGKQHAVRTMADESGAGCMAQFEDGRVEGLIASLMSAGTGCYNLGYLSGLSDLRIATRTGDVKVCGRECRKQYCKGLDNWNSGVSEHWLPGGLSQKDESCYHHGYYDGPVVGYSCK
jgi:hypothetical protein